MGIHRPEDRAETHIAAVGRIAFVELISVEDRAKAAAAHRRSLSVSLQKRLSFNLLSEWHSVFWMIALPKY